MVRGTNARPGVKNLDNSEARGEGHGEGFDLYQRGVPARGSRLGETAPRHLPLTAVRGLFSPLRASAYCRCARIGVQWMPQQFTGHNDHETSPPVTENLPAA